MKRNEDIQHYIESRRKVIEETMLAKIKELKIEDINTLIMFMNEDEYMYEHALLAIRVIDKYMPFINTDLIGFNGYNFYNIGYNKN